MLYLLLLAVSLVVGYLGYRRGPVTTFVAAVVGMTASLNVTELVIAGILRLYIFRPHLAPTMSQDHPLGFFLADFVSVPLLFGAGFVLFPRRRVLMGFVLTGVLALIEVGFMRAGVFFHQAWAIWYSVALFSVRFLLAIWWIPKFERVGYSPGFRALLMAMSTNVVWMFWVVWISSISRIWVIRPGLLTQPDSDRVLGMFLYHGVPFGVIGFLAVWLGWGKTARGWLLTAGLLIAYFLWLGGTRLWRLQGGWSPLLEGVVLTLLVAAVSYLDRWFAAHHPTQVRAGQKG